MTSSYSSSSKIFQSTPFIVGLSTALMVLLFFNELFFTGGVPYHRDFYFYVYPHLHFWKEALIGGEFPFWNPLILGGVPFSSDPMTGSFYPLHILFVLFDFVCALKIFLFLHFWIALLGAYYSGRQYKLSPMASLIVALIFAFSGYLIGITNYFTKLRGLVWIPLFFGLWEKSFQRPSLKAPLLAGLVLTLMILSGHFYSVYFTLLFLSIDFLFFQKEKFSRRLKIVLPIFLLGLSLSAIQWVPTLFFLRDSVRRDSLDKKEAMRWSLKPSRITEFAAPGLFGVSHLYYRSQKEQEEKVRWVHSLYFGFPALFLALLFLWKGQTKKKFFFLAILGIGLIFSLGKFTPIYGGVLKILPLLSRFRYPEKFLFWVTFASAFLAGFGYDHFFSEKIEPRRYLLAGILSFAFALLVLPPLPAEGTFPPPISYGALIRFLLITALLGIFLFYRKVYPWMGALFLGLLLADLYLVNRGEIPLIRPSVYREKPDTLKDLPEAKLWGDRLVRLPDDGFFSPPLYKKKNIGEKSVHLGRETAYVNIPSMVWLYPTAHGMTPARFWRFHMLERGFSQTMENQRKFFDLLGVRYIMAPLRESPFFEPYKVFRAYPEYKGGWFFNSRAFRRAVLYYKGQILSSAREVQEKIGAIDLRREVLVEGDKASGPFSYTPTNRGKISFLSFGLNQVEMEVDTSERCLLVLFDAYQKGWTVQVDKKEATLHPADILFRGVFLEKGNHRVVFSYTPGGHWLGLFLTFLGFLFLFFRMVKNWWKI